MLAHQGQVPNHGDSKNRIEENFSVPIAKIDLLARVTYLIRQWIVNDIVDAEHLDNDGTVTEGIS